MWVMHNGKEKYGGTFGEMKSLKLKSKSKDGCGRKARWMKQGIG